MSGLRVQEVTITGMQHVGMRRGKRLARHFGSLGVGVRVRTNEGSTTIRLNDLKGMQLRPVLMPGLFEQRFVDGNVLQRAHNVITRETVVRTRLVSEDIVQPDLSNLTFAYQETDAMFVVHIPAGKHWHQAKLIPVEPMPISVAAAVLNYGHGIFEGMKAFRAAEGNIVLFRPRDNAVRAQNGARRLGLTSVPQPYFLDAVRRVVKANERWVPPMGKGALYIRPLLIGSGPIVGVAPSPGNTFIVFVTPVGPYFKGGLNAISLIVSEKHHRAPLGGTGNVKAIGNYAPGMVPSKHAKAHGFAEIIYMDAAKHKYFEEVGAANFFIIIGNILYTPMLTGTILPGITRASVIQLARDLGYEVKETRVDWEMVKRADEAFCTGTAAVISPIGSITKGSERKTFGEGGVGERTSRLYEVLTAIQEQRAEDRHGWVETLIAA